MKNVLSIPMVVFKSIKDTMLSVRDIYVKGEDVPRMKASILRNGGYFSAMTGKPIYSVKDIDGDVKDYNGNIVLNSEDYRKGLVDSWGVSVEVNGLTGLLAAYAKRGMGLAGKGLKAAAKGMGKYYKWVGTTAKDIAGGIAGGVSGIADRMGFYGKDEMVKRIAALTGGGSDSTEVEGILNQQLFYQKGLYEKFVSNTKPEDSGEGYQFYTPDGELVGYTSTEAAAKVKKKATAGEDIDTDNLDSNDATTKEYLSEILDTQREIAGRDDESRHSADADGDRDRDNSWQDILSRKKDKGADKSVPDEKKEKEKVEQGQGPIGALLSGLGSIIGDGMSKLIDAVATVIGLKAAGDLLGGGPDIDGPDRRRGRRPGVLGKAANLLKKGVKSTAGFIATRAAPAIISTSVTAATAVGTALGTTAAVGGAVLLGGLAAVGAVGYGVYKLYKHLNFGSAVEPLEGLRYLQYGVNLADDDFVYLIRKLEDDVIDDAELTDDGFTLDEDVEYYYKEFAEDFGLDPDSESDARMWSAWFTRRFLMVMGAHYQALDTLGDADDLNDIDDELDDELKPKFIQSVRFTDADRAQGLDPMVITQSPFVGHELMNDPAVIEDYIKQLLSAYKEDKSFDPKKSLENIPKGSKEESKTPSVTSPEAAVATIALSDGTGYKSTISNKAMGVSAKGIGTTIAKANLTGIPGLVRLGANALASFFGSDKVEPLEGLRMLQYGVSLEDTELINAIRQLEKEVISEVSYNGKLPSLDEEPAYFYEEFHELFGMLDDGGPDALQWTTWFVKRFVPILFVHLESLQYIDSDVELQDVDDDLSDELKLKYINSVQFTEVHWRKGFWPYGIGESPMRGHGVITDQAVIEMYTRKLIDTLKLDKDLDAFDPSFLPEAVANDPKITMAIEKKKQSSNVVRESADFDKAPVVKGDVSQSSDVEGKGSTKLISPVAEGTVNSTVGDRIHPITGGVKEHKGMGYAAKTGTPVMAAADGTIYRMYRSSSYGNVIYLKHTDGKTTRYAHLHRFADGLTVGSAVKQGDVIGYVGSTGNSTGSHLHFEYRKTDAQNAPVLDPLKFFTTADMKKFTPPDEVDDVLNEPTDIDTATVGNLDAKNVNSDTANKSISDEMAKTMNLTSGDRTKQPVIKVDVKTDDKAMGELLSSQGDIANGAAEQRTAQIETQKEMVSKLDQLVALFSSKQSTNTPNIAKAVASGSSSGKTWGPTKVTTGVLDLDH
jgi:murein DD-endopeptidase MepM/ murein hydrolase activator NlpD